MAIIGTKGEYVSYECDDLIESLELDISEYGKSCRVYAISEMMQGVEIYTGYEYTDRIQLKQGHKYTLMSASQLMDILQKQNSIL
jgi:hypothetical protein|nr:MAG TPA: hypothetical protein [Bacteriophage sp.]